MSTVAEVRIWDHMVGAVAVQGPGEPAAFEYAEDFRASGLQVAPLMMPLGDTVYRFPALPPDTFLGLPGMLADALPDRFGNAVLDAWLATQGRMPGEIDAVERLCYTGARAMGALEFRPQRGPHARKSSPVHIDALVELAGDVLRGREGLRASLADPVRKEALREILRVGSSAGGARAKAVIAWHPDTGEVRSGQVKAPDGFEHWLLKFDGVPNNKDHDLTLPLGYGAIEYAYARMARAAGIEMSDCRLFEENGRRHFMTRRFDRLADGGKLHLQSLAALAHLDYNAAGAHGYEQALLVVRRLELGMDAVEDPDGAWTARHQMTLNGKRDGFTHADLEAVAAGASMKRGRASAVLAEVLDAARRWPEFAAEAGVDESRAAAVAATHRLELPA
jgi:serine/threonine-protein kinase HipA